MDNNFNKNNAKDLSELFKELQDIRFGNAKAEKAPELKKIKFNKIYVIDKRFNVVGAIIGSLFIVSFFSIINSNSIFAASNNDDTLKVSINQFEQNSSPLDMMNIISNNISGSIKKEIITKSLDIDYETEIKSNSQLADGEENILNQGEKGILETTYIDSYESNELIDEKKICENIKKEPVKEVIEKGTSKFLLDKNVKIGDTIYTNEKVPLYNTPNSESDLICNIYQYIDVTLNSMEENDSWCYVTVDGLEGYVESKYLTSESSYPGIKELARIQRIFIGVDFNMAINKPSGLTKEDFIKILSNNLEDKNKIIEANAEKFYEVEQKYNLNGIFLAAIAIHESDWGTSTIAIQKKNLFGYGSFDLSPYESSYTFESYEYGIDLLAKVLVKYYINPEGTKIYDNEEAVGTYYNGNTISGVNTRYASDEEWANKVYSIMKTLYKKLDT